MDWLHVTCIALSPDPPPSVLILHAKKAGDVPGNEAVYMCVSLLLHLYYDVHPTHLFTIRICVCRHYIHCSFLFPFCIVVV